ncbi:MAG: xanthine dehydrogenase family protein molybdopterin-binding subunit [Pseudomonadota bacterium]
MSQFALGQPVRRIEDLRLITGNGRFTDDGAAFGEVHGYVLRSPYAHADIVSLNVDAARGASGVIGVVTIDDLDADGVGDLPCSVRPDNSDGTPMYHPPRPALARGRIRHVGEPVAFVVAETLSQAKDAAELIEVDFEPLDAVASTAGAMAETAVVIWPDAPGNVALDWSNGDKAATEAAFAGAAHVITLDLVNNRVIVNPMEPRASRGSHDPATQRFELDSGSQGVHFLQNVLADKIFHVPRTSVHVTTGDVGGAFGMKNFLYPEQVLVLDAARRFGRPVRWTGERTESFMSDTQGRDNVTTAQLALDCDHRVLGLKVDLIANLGAYLSNYAPAVPTSASTILLSGLYDIPAIHVRVRAVYTNMVPMDAYRGAGRPETAYCVERLMDQAAAELGVAPEALRRKNFVPRDEFPYVTQVGMTYDDGDFARHLERALALGDHAGFEARRKASADAGRLRGFGFACYIERCGGGGPDMVDIRVDPSGGVTLFVGTITNGQGHDTAYAQLTADRLGVPIENVRIVQGDSDATPYGSGVGGSNFIAVGGNACAVAIDNVIDKGRKVAAQALEASEADIEFADGSFRIVGTDRSVSLTEVAAAALNPAKLPPETDPGLQAVGSYKAPGVTFPNGTHLCELEVDPETGVIDILNYLVVDDFGVIVNPMLVEGQVHGGVAQGVGQAFAEHTVYDETGQLLSGSFMDYQLPRASDLSSIAFETIEVPAKNNKLGVKGCGEAGATGSAPAAMNALLNALRPIGVRHVDMPATPDKLWRLIRQARENAA